MDWRGALTEVCYMPVDYTRVAGVGTGLDCKSNERGARVGYIDADIRSMPNAACLF